MVLSLSHTHMQALRDSDSIDELLVIIMAIGIEHT